jgi:hypothetical protein
MRNTPVALPAFSLMINEFDGFLMAPDAVGLQNFRTVSGNFDLLGDSAGIKKYNIFKPVNRLPHIMNRFILIWQMAFHAFFSPVRTGMDPCLIFTLHDMALRTKIGRFRLGEQFRRAEQKEKR